MGAISFEDVIGNGKGLVSIHTPCALFRRGLSSSSLRTLPDPALAHRRSSPSFSLQAFTSNHLFFYIEKLRGYRSIDNVTNPTCAPLR